MVRSRQPADMDENLFHEYIIDVFISYIRNLGQRPEFTKETAVLLMDSARPHLLERVLRVLGQNNIMAIVFPAHTMNIFQTLDLVSFALLKKRTQSGAGNSTKILRESKSQN
jgi:hypothetical protein